jgi:hypothetical protein
MEGMLLLLGKEKMGWILPYSRQGRHGIMTQHHGAMPGFTVAPESFRTEILAGYAVVQSGERE